VSGISIDAPAYAAALLSLVSFAVIYFLLPETLPPARRRHAPLRLGELNPLAAIGAMARKPGLGILLAVSCLFAFGFDAMNSTLGIYAAKVFAAEPWQIGLLFVVSGVVTAFTQAVLVPRVVGRFGEKTMAVVSQIGLSLGAAIIALAPALWWLYPNALIISGVGGFIWSTVGSLLAARVAPQEQGSLAGVNTALQSLMAVLGPLAAGVAYDHIAPAAPFGVSVFVFLAAAATMLSVRVPRQRAEAPAAPATN
jgi:DHA1 family tetracycline resistance protein-like MFS transporter